MRPTRLHHLGAARPRTQREGVSLLAAVMLVTSLSMLAASALVMSNSSMQRQVANRQQVAARLAADAGLAEAVTRMRSSGTAGLAALSQPMDFGGARFWVEAISDGSGVTSLVANGEMGSESFRQQLVVHQEPRSIYSYGAFGDEELHMASNSQVDSYDSDLGLYEDLEVNGSGQSAWANDRGTVGSNRNVIMRQNARTYGDAFAGPSGSVTIMGNAFVTGATGRSAELIVLDPIEVPAGASAGPLSVPSRGKIRLAPGTHVFGTASVGVQGVLEIHGPAKVVFDSLAVAKNSSVDIDSTNGLVEIYVRNDFVLSSNTRMAPRNLDSSGLALYLESDNIIDPGMNVDLDLIDFESNSKMYGTIYAPNANIVINSNFELYGSVVARRLRLDSNSQVHYDERLVENRDDADMTLEVIGWRVLPRRADASSEAPAETTQTPGETQDTSLIGRITNSILD